MIFLLQPKKKEILVEHNFFSGPNLNWVDQNELKPLVGINLDFSCNFVSGRLPTLDIGKRKKQ